MSFYFIYRWGMDKMMRVQIVKKQMM